MNSVLNCVLLTIFSQYVQLGSDWGKAAGKFLNVNITHHPDRMVLTHRVPIPGSTLRSDRQRAPSEIFDIEMAQDC